jgi:hypothetical protein
MKLLVGLDVSLEETAVCVIIEHGKIVKDAQLANEPEALLLWISKQDGPIAASTKNCSGRRRSGRQRAVLNQRGSGLKCFNQ